MLEVACVVAEAADIAALPVAQQAAGITLTAPVEDGDAEAAVGEISYGLEIFLDALVAPAQQHHCALQRAGDRGEDAIADLLAVAGGEEATGSVLRRRIALSQIEKVRHTALR